MEAFDPGAAPLIEGGYLRQSCLRAHHQAQAVYL